MGLLFGGLALGVALGGVMPLPYGPLAAVQQYVRAEQLAVQVIAVAVFAACSRSTPCCGPSRSSPPSHCAR